MGLSFRRSVKLLTKSVKTFDLARSFVISRPTNPSKYVKICQNMSKYVNFRFLEVHAKRQICHMSLFVFCVGCLGTGCIFRWRVIYGNRFQGLGQILGAHCCDQVIIIAFRTLPLPFTITSLRGRAILNYFSFKFPMQD